MNHEQIGSRLRDARIAAGMSIETASDVSGIAKSTIVRIEHGRYKCLYLTTIVTMCEMYGANIADITR